MWVHLVESVIIGGMAGVNGQRKVTSVQAESVLYGMQVELPLPLSPAGAHGAALSWPKPFWSLMPLPILMGLLRHGPY